MKRKYLLLYALCLITSFSWAQQGGILTANPDPINPELDAVVHYNGTGTNFANWTPLCHIHAWLVPKTGETFTGDYNIAWNSVDGNDQYNALDAKFKMTHDGNANSGQYDITLNLKNYFTISDEDLPKIDKVGIIVRSQYNGNNDQTIDFFLNVDYVQTTFTYTEIMAADVSSLDIANITSITTQAQLQAVSEKFGAASSCQVTAELAATLNLADKQNFNCPKAITATGNTVTYTRQAYQDGGWETLLLPFTVTSTLPADYEFQELNTGADNTSIIHFNIVTSLSANTPYVMRYTGTPAGGTAEVSFSGTQVQTNIAASSNTNKFTGIYTNSDKDDFPGYNVYGMNAAGTKFVKINTTGTALNAYRAFLKVPEAGGAPEYRALLEGETTGIEQKVVLGSLRVEGRRGAIQFIASVAQQVSLYSIEGKLVETLYLEEGETLLDGLLPGVYLVKNLKVLVK